jgi:hypothetical protein
VDKFEENWVLKINGYDITCESWTLTCNNKMKSILESGKLKGLLWD